MVHNDYMCALPSIPYKPDFFSGSLSTAYKLVVCEEHEFY